MLPAASALVLTKELSLVQQVVSDLQGMGIDVRQANTPAAAAQSLAEAPVNVVLCLTDGLDWRAALAAVKRDGRATPVVFLTRGADVPIWLEMLDAGAFDLLERRYLVQELQWVVSNAIGHFPRLAAAV
jgi:DNA-binding NtrC family response regulator